MKQVVSRAGLFLLAVGVILVPWTMRNHEVYGRFTPVGATLGQNIHFGMNSRYMNFDYPLDHQQRIAKANATVRRWLTAPPEAPWKRSSALNIIDQSSQNVRQGLAFAWEHPGFIFKTRIKKLADWASPMSFFVRHYGLDRYHGFLAGAVVRKVLILAALALPMLVMAAALAGLCFYLRRTTACGLVLWTLFYFASTGALIAGMSRYRICIVPFLIIFAAAFLCRAGKPWRGRIPALLCAAGWILLAALWSINAAEVWAAVKIIW